MKKLILLSLFGIFFLTGCSILKPNISENNVPLRFFDNDGKNISYTTSSDIFSGSFTGRKEKQELFFSYPDDHDPENVLLGYNNVTGNMYIYYFDNLGIKITFNDTAASYFYPKNRDYFEPQMYYSGNIIYYSKAPNYGYPAPAITLLSKDVFLNLSEIIQKDHSILLKNGCIPKLWEGKFNLLSGSENTYDIYYLEKNDGDVCFPGLFFIMNKNNLDRYYIISYTDACAPSCDTFTRIDFEYNAQ